MTPNATLTTRGTIRVTLTDLADSELVKQIPGRAYLGRGYGKTHPQWEIPGTTEAVNHLRRILPVCDIDNGVTTHLGRRDAWLHQVADARAGKLDLWPTKKISATPYEHQRVGHAVVSTLLCATDHVLLSTGSRASGLWHDMGLGKTITTLAVLADLNPRIALVACPASVIGVWTREAQRFCNYPIRVWPLTGDTRKRAAKVMTLPIDPFDGVTLLVTNYESLWRDAFLKALVAAEVEVMICDEAHRLKNAGSSQSKAARKISANAKRIALTGTPVDTLTDWYGIYRWMDHSVFGTSQTAFQARYFDTVQLPNGGVIVTGPKPDMKDELDTKANSLAHACSKDDALDLPERIDVDRFCALEPKARRAYNDMRDECIALLNDSAVVGQNVLTRRLRLSQITGGFVNDDNGVTHAVSSAKLDLLADVLMDVMVEGKVVIVARFTAEIDAIRRMLFAKKLVRGWEDCPVIDGRTPIGEKRDEAIRVFQEDSDVPVIIVQPRAGGAGITLHAAAHMIVYSEGDSLIDDQQVRDRIHRIGQVRRCTYVNLLVEGSVDVRNRANLRGKRDAAHGSVHYLRELLA